MTAGAGGEPAVVEARALGLRFPAGRSGPAVDALQDVHLRLAPGSMHALVGPDGAGKSTFLRLVAGLYSPTAGSLHVLGRDMRHPSAAQQVQERISYMPQRFGLYEDLSVQENLDLYADLHGVRGSRRAARYARLLEMTDLAAFTDRLAGRLSGGMKQKLGLACTLVRAPELLLLDEPTVGVDPLSRRELWQIVQQLVGDERLSVLVSTSSIDEAERCTQVSLFHQGRILADGTPAALRGKADGLCHAVQVAGGRPREIQAGLFDRRGVVLDAVPEAGDVRYTLWPGQPAADLPGAAGEGRGQPVDARLEDGVMVLLRQAERKGAAAGSGSGPGVGSGTGIGAGQPLQRPPHDDAPHPGGPRNGPSPRDGTAGAADEVVIEVRDLVKRFGDFTAVSHTSFQVRRGEVFGLLGANGAGKTTTFRMLCGLLQASGGTLRVAGVDLRTARAPARRHIGYVSQQFALYGNLTARENLRFFAGAYGLRGASGEARVREVLDEFALADVADQPSLALPGGYRQRLAMAAALIHRPEILFLDEPTSGADPLARRTFWRRITDLSRGGTTVVVTTHFMEEAEYCDRIVIQEKGQLLAQGSPDDVRRRARGAGQPAARLTMEEAFIRIVSGAREAADAKEPAR